MTTTAFRGLDPADLDGLRRRIADAEGSAGLKPIGMRQVLIGRDALDSVADVVDGVRRPGPVVVLQDTTPMVRRGADLKAGVAARLERIGDVRVAVIGTPGHPLHADAAALAAADAAIRDAGCVVAVGSGTITDIAKDASHRAGGLPFVVVQTAVSVNAFSDDMAVLLRDGVKRTVPSRWPDVLIVDEDVITDAPPEMNAAGYGELAAMFTAPADWYLAGALGADTTFQPTVVAVIRDSGDEYLAAADGVGARRPDATMALARLMTLSGFSLGIAGRTAPLSGTEHLVSHLLDMAAAARGERTAFHGSQVGVAAVPVALIWRAVLDSFDPATLADESAFPSPAAMQARVEDAFGWLDADGRAAAECWRDYATKLEGWTSRRAALAALAADWPAHRETLERLLVRPELLADALRRAGSPARFRDLDPPVDERTARWALRSCFLMRNRFTVADLAWFAGLWDDRFVDRILDEAAGLGAGL